MSLDGLGPDARALLDAAEGGDEPSAADAARVRRRIAALALLLVAFAMAARVDAQFSQFFRSFRSVRAAPVRSHRNPDRIDPKIVAPPPTESRIAAAVGLVPSSTAIGMM